MLCGQLDFTGRLPEPWYRSVDGIVTDEYLFPREDGEICTAHA